jgi:hypothetical protein
MPFVTLGFEIKHHGALISVETRKVPTEPIDLISLGANGIALRAFNLNNIGPQIS